MRSQKAAVGMSILSPFLLTLPVFRQEPDPPAAESEGRAEGRRGDHPQVRWGKQHLELGAPLQGSDSQGGSSTPRQRSMCDCYPPSHQWFQTALPGSKITSPESIHYKTQSGIILLLRIAPWLFIISKRSPNYSTQSSKPAMNFPHLAPAAPHAIAFPEQPTTLCTRAVSAP